MITIQEDYFTPEDPTANIIELAKNKMDRTEKYDFGSPFPRVRYVYEKKKGYCAKYQIDFLMVEDGMKRLVQIVFPMILLGKSP
jgi:hypothetical protein